MEIQLEVLEPNAQPLPPKKLNPVPGTGINFSEDGVGVEFGLGFGV